ncbi:MAG: hypothetical protein ACLFU5_07960 [Thermoplasmata archaeon]
MRTLYLSMIAAMLLIISLPLISAESDSAESDISIEVEEKKSETKEKTQKVEEKNDVENNPLSYGMVFVLFYVIFRCSIAFKRKENENAQNK